MNIVVCIKQVPDTKGGVKFNPDGTLDRAAMLAIMNPDDKAGLEAALRIKDETGAKVTVLTMGLPKADAVLREALAMGADEAVLVTDRVLGGADTWATSTTIAGALRNLDYDLIITGCLLYTSCYHQMQDVSLITGCVSALILYQVQQPVGNHRSQEMYSLLSDLFLLLQKQ